MYISFEHILRNSLFEQATILAGEKGLSRKVNRISVFDCPWSTDLQERGLLKKGDVFISGLAQFDSGDEDIRQYIDTLIKGGSAGLFIVTGDMLHVLTDDIIQKCNKHNYPLILIPTEIPYADIITTFNQYIVLDDLNALNMMKIDKIMNSNISQVEKMDILYSMNSQFESYIRVIDVAGQINSDVAKTTLHMKCLQMNQDLCVMGKDKTIFIISNNDEKALRHHTDSVSSQLGGYFDNPIFGYSSIVPKRNITKALEEAKQAKEMARAMKMTQQVYDPMSSLQLLLTLKDTQEAADFYKAYVKKIKKEVSAEYLPDILLTMEYFVANSGNYSETAKDMHAHENTIRYRVNQVKKALGMENDNIKFHETVAMAVKLRILLNKNI